jgi:hypothetical protein
MLIWYNYIIRTKREALARWKLTSAEDAEHRSRSLLPKYTIAGSREDRNGDKAMETSGMPKTKEQIVHAIRELLGIIQPTGILSAWEFDGMRRRSLVALYLALKEGRASYDA